jgi:hypothetical protein
LLIPDDEYIVAAVNGAITTLMFPWSWEQYGAVTPGVIAEAMREMAQEFFNSDGQCISMTDVDVFRHRENQGTNGGGITANTPTIIPFITPDPLNSGRVSLDENNRFVIEPGFYKVRMWHNVNCGNAKTKCWFEDTEGNTVIDGSGWGQLVENERRLEFSGVLNSSSSLTAWCVALNSVTNGGNFFGVAFNTAGYDELYGEVVFERLGDAIT